MRGKHVLVATIVALTQQLAIAGFDDPQVVVPGSAFRAMACDTTRFAPQVVMVRPKYEQDGHLETTARVAAASLGPEEAAVLAFYSQAPDAQALRFSAAAVGVWGLPVYFGYRHRIVNSLHSLHGGDAQAVRLRRGRLEQELAARLATPLDFGHGLEAFWQAGFLIHALGDAHAHVDDTDPDNLQAYGELVGHVFANLKGGRKPDDISLHFAQYADYLRALRRLLPPRPDIAVVEAKAFDRLVQNAAGAPPQTVERAKEDYLANFAGGFCELTEETKEALNAELTIAKVDAFLRQIADRLDARP